MGKLIIHTISKNFDIRKDFIASIANKVGEETDKNEFTGLKEKSSYYYKNELVCTKHFSILNAIDPNGKKIKGTLVELRYYDEETKHLPIEQRNYVSHETYDSYTDTEIKEFKKKNIIFIWSKLLSDMEAEIAQVPGAQGVQLKALFDNMFKVILKDEIDYLYKNGDTKPLYDRLNSGDAIFENLKLIPVKTSERKLNLFQVLVLKFNPQNFRYYENS